MHSASAKQHANYSGSTSGRSEHLRGSCNRLNATVHDTRRKRHPLHHVDLPRTNRFRHKLNQR